MTKKEIKENWNSIAAQFTSPEAFKKYEPEVFEYCEKNNILHKITWTRKSHKPRIKLDDQLALEESKKYKTKKDFRDAAPYIYQYASLKGLLSQMTWLERKSIIKWTEETCLQEAKKYKTVADFRKNSSSAFQKANVNGWILNYDWLEKAKCGRPKRN